MTFTDTPYYNFAEARLSHVVDDPVESDVIKNNDDGDGDVPGK